MIRGLNKLDALPGVSINIEEVGKPDWLAAGGIPQRKVGSGFMTNGARAIVGEGKRSYPEFVIPTDPTYRNRARSLLSAAGQRLGASVDYTRKGILGDSMSDIMRSVRHGSRNAYDALPRFEEGGIIGTIKHAAGSVKDLAGKGLDWMKGNIKKLASLPFAAFKKLAKQAIERISWKVGREVANSALDKVTAFVTKVDSALYDKAKGVKSYQAAQAAGGGTYNGTLSTNARIRKAQKFALNQQGKPYIWSGVGPGGYDCSGFQSAITNVLMGRYPHRRLGATASFPWAGFAAGRGKYTIGSTPNYGGSGIGHMAGTLGNMNVESRGGQGVVIGNAARGYMDSGFSQRAHLIGLKYGAIVAGRRGGIDARIGEGNHDELVTPLPRGWRNKGVGDTTSTTHIHIGKVELPNIKSGDDAEELVKNLQLLAKD
jgi:hypothetical protein